MSKTKKSELKKYVYFLVGIVFICTFVNIRFNY